MTFAKANTYKEIIISHPGTDFDSMASMWAAHLLDPDHPVVMIAGVDSNVREFLALYGHEFPRLRLKEIDISSVEHVTIVDCSSRSQLSRIEGILDRKDVIIEIWDHHREQGVEFRVDKHHYAPVGANTTILVNELMRRGIRPSATASTLLMLGIYEDTGSLRFPSTTPADIEASAWLLENGASLESLDRFLDIRLTRAQKSLLTALTLNVRVVEIRGVPVHVTQAAAREFVDEIAFLARKVQETESADVLFALVQLNDRVFIVGRSRLPSVDVGRILSVFGGGGHPQAASCLLTGTTHPIALQRLLDAVREQVRPTIRARDIMSHPVKTISPDAPISEVDSIITRTGHSGLVVVKDDAHVVGIITRREVDKALVHGLGHAPVKGYMVREPVTVQEEATLGELQNVIIERQAGFLPVLFGGRLSGVVTRTDVLGAIHKAGGVSAPTGNAPVQASRAEDKGRELLSLVSPSLMMILAMAGELADRVGVSCYLVGGIVRDLVLGKSNVDIDLLIEGDGISFAMQLGELLQGHVIDNTRFRTAKIILPDGLHIDVATAREEFYVHPGALPEVEAATIRDDLLRRDFSINTLVIQLNSRKWGHLVDHFGGLQDLKSGIIRVLHTFSFVDDPTRILRALRFSARYKFPLEKQTAVLLRRALLEGRLDDVSPERVRDEILLCLREEEKWIALGRLVEEGIFGVLQSAIFPPRAFGKPEEDALEPAIAWIRGLIGVDDMPDLSDVYFAFLISDTEPVEALQFIEHFHFDSSIAKLAEAIEGYRSARSGLGNNDLKPSEIVDLLESLPVEYWILLAMGKPEDSIEHQNLSRFLTELRHVKLEITGSDLIAAGFKPGRAFSETLHTVRQARLNGEVNNRDEELALAKKILST